MPDGRDYKCEDKRIPSGKGVLMERTDPVRGGEVWLLYGLCDEKEQAAGEGRNREKFKETPTDT